jgi:hypothetical protein
MFPNNVPLAIAYISFEALHDVQRARRIAKGFLKMNQTNLKLWNGKWEWGHTERERKGDTERRREKRGTSYRERPEREIEKKRQGKIRKDREEREREREEREEREKERKKERRKSELELPFFRIRERRGSKSEPGGSQTGTGHLSPSLSYLWPIMPSYFRCTVLRYHCITSCLQRVREMRRYSFVASLR